MERPDPEAVRLTFEDEADRLGLENKNLRDALRIALRELQRHEDAPGSGTETMATAVVRTALAAEPASNPDGLRDTLRKIAEHGGDDPDSGNVDELTKARAFEECQAWAKEALGLIPKQGLPVAPWDD